MYKRKTRDYWEVQANYGYGYGWEVVTAEDDRKEARARLREYRENEPQYPHRMVKKRIAMEFPCYTCGATDHSTYEHSNEVRQ